MEPHESVLKQPIILGCATFGGVGSLPDLVGRGEGREAVFELMEAAWTGGIHAFDTADAYGGGLSEQWIGEWVAVTGRRPWITTKTYNAMSPVGDRGLSRERLLRQVHTSLERLCVDRIDVYLAHEFDANTPVNETFEAFQELVDTGLVAAYGVSNFSAAQLNAVLSVARPSLLQNSYSLLNRQDESAVIPMARQHGVSYQAYSPLAGGWLSGKYRSGQPIPRDSRLALVPQWYEHIDETRAFKALAQLDDLARESETSISALAHGWLLAQPDVDGVVVGPRRVEHLVPVFEARDSTLDPSLVDRLSAIFS